MTVAISKHHQNLKVENKKATNLVRVLLLLSLLKMSIEKSSLKEQLSSCDGLSFSDFVSPQSH
jgi:hypothetical protein